MTTAILRQSGGSAILSIPKALLEAAGLSAGSKVNLGLEGRVLTVAPSYSIDDLVSRMAPENAHPLIEFGEVGSERVEW